MYALGCLKWRDVTGSISEQDRTAVFGSIAKKPLSPGETFRDRAISLGVLRKFQPTKQELESTRNMAATFHAQKFVLLEYLSRSFGTSEEKIFLLPKILTHIDNYVMPIDKQKNEQAHQVVELAYDRYLARSHRVEHIRDCKPHLHTDNLAGILYCGKENDNPESHYQTNENFITAFYGIFDLKKNSITYCNSGHLPPFIIDNDNITVFETSINMPIAITENKELSMQGKSYKNIERYSI